jgi:hypothetical protein
VFVVLVTAVAAWAAPSPQATTNAGAACRTMKAQMGGTAFAQAYATFGRCVSSIVRVETQNIASAQSTCADLKNGTHGNTFGKCVSTTAKASSRAEQHGRLNPARLCSTERKTVGATSFSDRYGTNKNHRNAHGKCVATMAHQQTRNELGAATACRAEQGDAGFAAANAGKTFAQAYGTNAGLSNAFGKCVSGKSRTTTQAQVHAEITAVKACAAERRAGAAAFRTKYGTFARCVKQQLSTG